MNERRFETVGSIQVDREVDFEDCHTDPVHRSAHIQPHGTFLELDTSTLEIRSAAGNVDEFLSPDTSSLPGEPLESVIKQETCEEIRTFFNHEFPARKHFIIPGPSGSRSLYLFPVGPPDSAGMEIENLETDQEQAQTLITNITDRLDDLRDINERSTLYERTLNSIASFTGYDRLMLYRFNEDGHGSVVAEQKADELDSYLGHQFPASDIPDPARRLYQKNTLRIIPDAVYEPVPIFGPEGQRRREELDLTYSDLRSVPAIHRKYMKNMGVRASLSVSLLVEGELWGLISCHAMEPYGIDWSQKSACKQISRTVSQQLSTIKSLEREQLHEKAIQLEEAINASFSSYTHLFERLRDDAETLLSLMTAGVFYLRLNEESLLISEDESSNEYVRELIPGIREELKTADSCSVQSIVGEWDDSWTHSSEVSGFFALRLDKSADSFCVWFRPENRTEIEWGGDPRGPVEVDQDGTLSPRSSFETWTQVVSKRSRRWTELDEFTARELKRVFKGLEIELQKNLLQDRNRQIESKNEILRETKERLEETNREKERLLERVKEIARTDDLTGLFNRDELMKLLSRELKRCLRYDQNLTLLFLDLDHFKDVNDRYGHQTGDIVLESIADLLREHSRDSDILGRYGGEEFIAVFPNTNLDSATNFADRFLDTLRQHTFKTDDHSFRMTCSIGLAELRPQDEPEEIIERADDALYRAKNSGRDTYVVADSS